MNSVLFFSSTTVWIVSRSIVFMLFKKLLCLQMLWVMEFKVQFENVVLWSEWFLSLLSEVYFYSNQSFSSLCNRGVEEETNYFYRCTAEVFSNLTFFLFDLVSWTWIVAIVLYAATVAEAKQWTTRWIVLIFVDSLVY